MTAPRSEHAVQNGIRNALVDSGIFFRANVGKAWASNDIGKLPDGSLLLRNPRPFSTGLPPGFTDLFGFVTVRVTPDMVGQDVALFVAIECKSSKGPTREKQERFIKAVNDAGGRAGFARSEADALAIAQGVAHARK